MSVPALRALRARYPKAYIAILAKPWVADIYRRESFCDDLVPYVATTLREKFDASRRVQGYDMALLLQNAFEAAMLAFGARIPQRIGYNRDGRGWLLTQAIPVPRKGEIPEHERFYYLELLRRAGIIDSLPECDAIRLEGSEQARGEGLKKLAELDLGETVVGVSPGAAFGSAKRWLPERFAETASRVAAELGASVAIFGSEQERELCEQVGRAIPGRVRNFAGQTSLAEFINLAAACRVFLTNDSGAMHIASALGVPTVTVFGATNHITTGPTGPLARIVREDVECSPCQKRECPIDHRCMTRVSSERVTNVALDLLKVDLLK